MPEIVPMPHYPSLTQDRRRHSPLAQADRSYYHTSARPQAVVTASNTHWQQLPIRGISYTLAEHTSHLSPLFSSFTIHEADWPIDTVLPATYAPPLAANVAQTISYSIQSDFPESSQRTSISSSPVNVAVNYGYQNDMQRSPSKSPDCSDDGQRLYTMDEADTPLSCRSPSFPSPSIKTEQSDANGCFVMELSAAQVKAISLSQSMAPQTGVPIRATHAPDEMRKMMGRFRIDPFAIHSGENRGVVAPRGGGEACPLEEEPLIFEFQLDLNNAQSNDSEDPSNDISQTDMEVHRDRSDLNVSPWDEYCGDGSILMSNCTSEWNEEQYPSEPATEFCQQQLDESYLSKCGAQNCTAYVGETGSTQEVNYIGHRGEFWTRNGGCNGTFDSDSPGCESVILPSISTTVSRRWTVPNSHMTNDVQFLMH
ncbi:hypothetical protein AX15_000373 [Amanita polypyramis BW_CC]|nr:hypothetical protein AX15_000373 [Amanita polypyramis BW_CC]